MGAHQGRRDTLTSLEDFKWSFYIDLVMIEWLLSDIILRGMICSIWSSKLCNFLHNQAKHRIRSIQPPHRARLHEPFDQARPRRCDLRDSSLLGFPALLLVAAAIKLSSPGPIFFVQESIGRNKQPFRIYKFRTMIPDAEASFTDLKAKNETGGAAFKMKNDPRVTRLANFSGAPASTSYPN